MSEMAPEAYVPAGHSCLHCYATTNNGLALCERCRMAASVNLEFLPVYFRNLARWRPGRAGGRPVPGSREPAGAFTTPAGNQDRVSRALDDAGTVIAEWAKKVADARNIELPEQGDEAETVTAYCRMLTESLTRIALFDWAGEFVRVMAHHEGLLRTLTERVAPGWYAGACRRCDLGTYVVPGLTWVTCNGCGATTYARDHLDTILDEARGWVARPMRIAEATVALVDTEMSVPRLYERIKKWEQREKITGLRRTDTDGDPIGPKRYRFGDVLDRIQDEGATRLDRTLDAEAS